MSLIHDPYAIAVKTVGTGRKIGRVPKFMSKFAYYFLRHGGVVRGTVLGERQYSWDLQQGGLQIPTLYNFSCGDHRVLELFKTNILRLVEENFLESSVFLFVLLPWISVTSKLMNIFL